MNRVRPNDWMTPQGPVRPAVAGTRRPAGFTLVELLTVIAIIGLLVTMLLPAIQSAREAGRRTACGSNLKQLGVALASHEAARQRFPPSSRSLGWCQVITGTYDKDTTIYNLNGLVLLLPYLDEAAIFDLYYNPRAASGLSFDPNNQTEAPAANLPEGNGPTVANAAGGNNAQLSAQIVRLLICPTDSGDRTMPDNDVRYAAKKSSGNPAAKTNYDFSVNPVSDYCNDWLVTTGSNRFMFGENSTTNAAMVIDGLSNTIAMAETTLVNANPSGKGNSWAFRSNQMLGASPASAGINPWQSTWTNPPTPGRPQVKAGQVGRWGWSGGNHVTGCNLLFGDGSMRFVSQETDIVVLLDLSRMANRGRTIGDLP